MTFRFTTTVCLILGIATAGLYAASGHAAEPARTAPLRITTAINNADSVVLHGHVLKALTPDRDLGAVEDTKPLRLYLNLRRTPQQQADLDALLARQQQPGAAEYHQWLTPEQFGQRFGAAEADITKVRQWLESQGFEVTSVAKNASVISFRATAGQLRNSMQADVHYWNVQGGKYAATATEPHIPAALSTLVGGIAGLNQIPAKGHHTPIHQERYDAATHKWFPVASSKLEAASAQPHFHTADGSYNVTPQDFYTIYNINPTFRSGNVGAGATIAILGSGPFNYGTVSGGAAGGKATGGDVTTFRRLFGITTPLNLLIESGSANFPCTVSTAANSGESALDVEWAGATAPGATLIFESCANSDGSGSDFLTEIQALVDANVADIISSSLGFSEPNVSLAGVQAYETAFAQGAAQGQTFLSAQGDSGSDDVDFNAAQGTHGLSVDYPGSSTLVLSVGGTDFQDLFDVFAGSSIPQSTYWGANSQFYGNALGYVPETTWNDSCASPLVAATSQFGGAPGESTALFCNSANGRSFGSGGGGGISTFYAQPSWQKGIPGLSAAITKRVTPDVSLFSATGQYWGHAIVVCDSGGGQPCTSPSTFGFAGGTSFAAPSFAGILGLLKTSTGSRLGLIQPALYALAKTQYAAGTACYANGQTANTGITTSLPASTCVFNDVTTSGNNNECVAGTPDCFADPGASYGVMTSSGNTAKFVDAYPAGARYDIATGLGSVNVTNLVNNWHAAFTSSTSLKANPATITAAQSTTLTATVVTGTPTGSTGPVPALKGQVSFSSAGTTLATCTLSGNSCSVVVSATLLKTGANAVTATFSGSATYPASTSAAVTVTVSAPTGNTVSLVATNTLVEKAGGGYQDTVKVTNTGGVAAQNVVLTRVSFGSATGSIAAGSIGTLAPGASALVIVSVPAAAGAPGSLVAETLAGTYTGGSFGGTYRITLP